VLDHSTKFAAGFHLTTGFTMGLRNTHSNVLIYGRPFWLHAVLFNSAVSVVMAIAVEFANPEPWGILQWAFYISGELASYGLFLCSACCSTWMVRSYWYPQFSNATAGLAHGAADSRCQLGTGTGMGACPLHVCDSLEDLEFDWGDLICTESESPRENMSQASVGNATSSVASTEPPQSTSTSDADEDDANLRPRKLPRFQTALPGTALTVDVKDKATSTSVSREIPAVAASVPALVKSNVVDMSRAWIDGLVKHDVVDISEALIDGLAAAPSFPSWDQYVSQQQRQQKEASVTAAQQHERWAAAHEAAGLRDLLLDALTGGPCDHDQQVDILLHKLAQT